MTKKQMKSIAKQLAKYENIVQTSENSQEIHEAQDKIIQINESLNFEDISEMIMLDEMVSEIIYREKDKN